MTYRVTNDDLKKVLNLINKASGVEHGLDYAYGGVRLVKNNGSNDVLPRGTKKECFEFMHAYLKGIEIAQKDLTPLKNQIGNYIGFIDALAVHGKMTSESWALANKLNNNSEKLLEQF